ncbi:hypothetical protein F4810DRAFT_404722 [Camillea tinctor]|nr:hypothetical protein F4810DRAFT_404722 [Camillea tinctor]
MYIPYHTIPYHTIPDQTRPYHTTYPLLLPIEFPGFFFPPDDEKMQLCNVSLLPFPFPFPFSLPSLFSLSFPSLFLFLFLFLLFPLSRFLAIRVFHFFSPAEPRPKSTCIPRIFLRGRECETKQSPVQMFTCSAYSDHHLLPLPFPLITNLA